MICTPPNYGVIPLCRHCGRKNVPKLTKNQVTCGSMRCRYLQGEYRRHLISAAKKARKAK